MDLKSLIRDIPDFPQPGVMFRDITPLLQSPAALHQAVDELCQKLRVYPVDTIVAIESRGFIFGAPVAYKLGVPLVPVRKVGKLPRQTVRVEYALEYGSSVVEMHQDGVVPGKNVAIVDDLLATGGTAAATIGLVEKVRGTVSALVFLIELDYLQGRQRLAGYPIVSLIRYQ
jgi:adenine phosphoribosyltransferase